MSHPQPARLIFLFFAAFMLLNFPILGIFGDSVFVLGIPAVFLYLLIFWALFIGMVYWEVNKVRKES